jgi:asparagine synthase (glutamine-hydrolysing)
VCGICGFVTFHQPGTLAEDILRGMCTTLLHRGPDDEGYYFDNHAALGIRRLSIIDLVTGQQPIGNENRTLWVVFNGEIYNYRQLRKILEQRGHVFRTQSDTEVIVHAYEEYGDACVSHLNGMFAFALWDKPRQRLLCARDHLGIKPLYYYSDGHSLVFGSELKALLAHPGVPTRMNPVALDLFLTLEYVPGPHTIYQDIHKLLPGHILAFERGNLTVHRYWNIPVEPVTSDEEACVEQLRDLIKDAVQMQLVSDVPLGAFLSGGIDSSSVVAYMSQASNEPVRTFSIGFADQSYNELADARLVANHFGCLHHEQVLEPDITDLVERLVTHMDEPFGDFSIFPTYLVSKLAAQHVKVALSGDGGDELFGGYDTYVAEGLDGIYRRLPHVLRTRLLPALIGRIPPRPVKKGLINKTKRFIEGAALDPALQHTRWMMFMNAMERDTLYTHDLTASLDGNDVPAHLLAHFREAAGHSLLTQQQYVDLKTYLVDDILVKVDRMSMVASLETRVPLLDYRIVEFALNLPDRMKVHSGKTKRILRRAMAPILPDSVLKKSKQGFSIPIKHWLRQELRPMMMDLLAPDRIKHRGYFNPDTVSRWVKEHQEGRTNHSHRLWALMVFELWQRFIADATRYS